MEDPPAHWRTDASEIMPSSKFANRTSAALISLFVKHANAMTGMFRYKFAKLRQLELQSYASLWV